MWKSDLLRFPFRIHFTSRWACVNSLRMSFEDLKLLRRCARTNRERKKIVELMNHEVEVYSLFPVDIGIANRQLLRVLSKDFDFCVILWRRSVTALDILFSNKEQQII